jgi:uncharacterized protein
MDNIQIVQQVYKSFGEGNIPAILSHFDKDVVWERPGAPHIPFSGTFNGHQGLIDFFTLVAQNVKISEFSPKKFLSNEDTVAVTGDDEATVISTGKKYKTHWVQTFVLKNGKIISGRVYIDTLQIAKAFQS